MNQYMKEKCDKFSTKECEFTIEALRSKGKRKRKRYVIKVRANGECFNLFDTIYDNYNGNLCIGRNIPRQLLSLNKTLINVLSRQEASADNIKIDELDNRYVEDIFATIASRFKPIQVKKMLVQTMKYLLKEKMLISKNAIGHVKYVMLIALI